MQAVPSTASKRAPNRFPRSVKEARVLLTASSWYRSPTAAQLRTVLYSKALATIMGMALIFALFLPDVWIICGVNSNAEVDVLLTVVMVMFTGELIMLSAVDAPYFLSFFFTMDFVGTISMIADISYMLGQSNTEARSAEDSAGGEDLMLLRASRAARVGARAGRLSRVVRIFRFLPFLMDPKTTIQERRGMANAISTQLANLLATRVACLTIVLVMVIPLFDILTFPQSDYALQAWVERLSSHLKDGNNTAFSKEIAEMADFFSRHSYGPYKACTGVSGDGSFQCANVITSWSPRLPAPPREASSLMVYSSTFMVAFNMQSTIRVESIMAAGNILFIIFIMIFSGLALSSVVNELAVRPLQRMLGTVQHIATTVFKFNEDLIDEYKDEDEADIEVSGEMKLLEKVVAKLAIIADLRTRDGTTQNLEDMREEDIGILGLMQGKNVLDEVANAERRKTQARTSSASRSSRKKSLIPGQLTAEIGVTEEIFDSWAFNTLAMPLCNQRSLCIFVIGQFHLGGGYVRTKEEERTLVSFVHAVEKQYLPNVFHNFSHASDVLHASARLMRLIGSEAFLTELEQFSILIAATGHDVGHPGVNNGFLSEIGHELALKYNDKSPLENMHCSKLYGILAKPETNVLAQMSREEYRQMRQLCIETILHTDMVGHMAMVKDLQMTFQMNQDKFLAESGMYSFAGAAEAEVFSQPESKMLAMNCILHSADVSNPCRVWEVASQWAHCVLEEFFSQGDQEKQLGIPVQFLNDRDKLNRPNSQIGFIEFMIAPFFVAQIRLWPALCGLGENLAYNISRWEELWCNETQPSEEDKGKVHARVCKVQDNLQEAKCRVVVAQA